MATSAGSIWRVWDLHVHTPASLTWTGQQFRDMTPDDADAACRAIVERMNESDAAAFAVMDYWTFDGYLRIRSFLRAHPEVRLQKSLFPGIELRCESPSPARLNIHALLSDELTDQQLSDFKSALRVLLVNRPLSDDAIAAVADELAPDKIRSLGHRMDDRTSASGRLLIGHKAALVTKDSLFGAIELLPAGTALLFLPFDTYHGVRDINWREHPLLTTEFMRRADILEVRQPDAIDACHGVRTDANAGFLGNFLQTLGGKPKPAVSGSDAHSIAHYAVFPLDQFKRPRRTWVKADPTFRGLMHLLTEPAARIFIGPEPPKLSLVREHPTKYIRSLTIRKKAGSDLDEAWFDTELRFNHDLVAVIGNRGQGKSALADILGLLGCSRTHADSSFLHPDKFRQPKQNKAKHFQATLAWESGETVTRSLDETPGPHEVERIRYLPQNYLEKVCNEVRLGHGGRFDTELKSVIFSHVPPAERLGQESLDGLITLRTKQTQETIGILKGQLADLNAEIVRLEKHAAPDYREAVLSQFGLKEKELLAHDAIRPLAVPQPSADPAARAVMEAWEREIQDARAELSQADGGFTQATAEERRLNRLLARVAAAAGHLDNLRRLCDEYAEKLSAELTELGLRVEDIVTVTIDRAKLDERRVALDLAVGEAKALLDPGRVGSPAARKAAAATRIGDAQAKLDGPSKQHQEYLSAMAAWQAERDRLVGDAQTPGTREYLKHALASLDSLPGQLTELRTLRRAKAGAIYDEVARLADTYRTVYRPVQEFTDQHDLINERFGLNFSVTIRTAADFADQFFSIVHRGVAGSFCGMEEGEQAFKDLADRHDFQSREGALAFADELLGHLTEDRRGGKTAPAVVAKQVRKGHSPEALYDFVYGFGYLQPQYSLNLGQKELPQLSAGERGMLLLVFYLLIDKDNIPLVIDQPEGNLDNKTIYRLLGECIKAAKTRRQIFIVTHNPNLAVACDAEQVVHAQLDQKDGNRITYSAGGIENPEINRASVDILEGTRPAFDNRDSKYFAEAR